MDFNIEDSFLMCSADNKHDLESYPEDEDSEKIPKVSTRKPMRYSASDDLEILKYIRSKPKEGHISRRFWQRAIEFDFLLKKTRTVDSLRDRYRNHLRRYTEKDFIEWKNT